MQKDNSFIVKGNQIFQVYGFLSDSVVVYDRKSETGLSTIKHKQYDDTIVSFSQDFDRKFKAFLNFVFNDLSSINKEGYDNWSYKKCVQYNFCQALGLEPFITDCDADDVRSEITVRMTYEYLANLTAPKELYPVKLYVIEQLLQKSYYHILNDEWLMDKAKDPSIDTLEYSSVEIVMPEGV
jgi:hypothetical protein